MMHTGRGREHPLHVEYVHIGACLAFIQDTLTEALLSHPRLRMDKKIALVRAIGKVIWVQNDLFAKWYVRDGDEFADEMEKQEVEAEGFLHGKKILDDIEEGLPSSPTCPFSGLSAAAKADACAGGCGDKCDKENGCSTTTLPLRPHIQSN